MSDPCLELYQEAEKDYRKLKDGILSLSKQEPPEIQEAIARILHQVHMEVMDGQLARFMELERKIEAFAQECK